MSANMGSCTVSYIGGFLFYLNETQRTTFSKEASLLVPFYEEKKLPEVSWQQCAEKCQGHVTAHILQE